MTSEKRAKSIIILLGGLSGFAYWYFIGCTTGSCPLTANPYSSTIIGLLIGVFASFLLFKNSSERKSKVDIQSIVKTQNPTIIDVRTPMEFNGDHAKGAINIPLNEIPDQLEKIKGMKKPIVLCCASGGRSGQAHNFLEKNGVSDTYNGGGYYWVKSYQS